MVWFRLRKTPRIKKLSFRNASKIPDGLWTQCPECKEVFETKKLEEAFEVCFHCGFCFPLEVSKRIALLTDAQGVLEVYGQNWWSQDPLKFQDRKNYQERLNQYEKKKSFHEAIWVGKVSLSGMHYFLGVFDFRFLGGSMGVVVGEKIALLFEKAQKERLPLVFVCASGGARMQEGIFSLMQMAKISVCRARLRKARVPLISLLTHPTTGGVAASLAFQADFVFAEHGALIGFAGPRVIAQTMGESLPKGFQRSELLLKKGFLDQIWPRAIQKRELTWWLRFFSTSRT